jgi:hypothetical protein
LGMFLREPGAAFDISEEKSDGACWELIRVSHWKH